MKKSYRRILSVGLFVVLIGGLVFALTGCGFLNQAPIAIIESDPSPTDGTVEVAVDENIEFNGSDSRDIDGDIESYDWNFDENFTQHTADGEAVQSVSYDLAGSYTVKLTVTDDGGKEASETQDVEVG